MSGKSIAGKIKINSFNDICGGGGDSVQEIALADLHTFTGHPFRVEDDEKMTELVESIRENGVLVPGIARRRAEGGYELISGHRRKRASMLAGKETMPVIVRHYTDDDATIIMVDSNLQREKILPSEKAKAYAMKYDAMKKKKKKGGLSLEKVGEVAGENYKTVQRYLWLARLIDGLLELVDQEKIKLYPGVNLSFLEEDQQKVVLSVLLDMNCGISLEQSKEIKMLAEDDGVNEASVRMVMVGSKEKPRRYTMKADVLDQYFPPNVTDEVIENTVREALNYFFEHKLGGSPK